MMQSWNLQNSFQLPWRRDRARMPESPLVSLMDLCLRSLRNLRGELTACLHRSQVGFCQASLFQWLRNNIGSCNRILNRQVDPYATCRRHRMRGIANAEEAVTIPAPEPVDLHGENLYLVPVAQFIHAFVQIRRDLENAGLERIETTLLDLLEGAFADDESGLKIVRAIDQDEGFPIVHVAQHLARIGWSPADPEPQNVNRSADLNQLKIACFTRDRMPTVAADDQIGANVNWSLFRAPG